MSMARPETIYIHIHGGRPDTFGENAADGEPARIPDGSFGFDCMDTEWDGLYRGQETGDISVFVEIKTTGRR